MEQLAIPERVSKASLVAVAAEQYADAHRRSCRPGLVNDERCLRLDVVEEHERWWGPAGAESSRSNHVRLVLEVRHRGDCETEARDLRGVPIVVLESPDRRNREARAPP